MLRWRLGGGGGRFAFPRSGGIHGQAKTRCQTRRALNLHQRNESCPCPPRAPRPPSSSTLHSVFAKHQCNLPLPGLGRPGTRGFDGPTTGSLVLKELRCALRRDVYFPPCIGEKLPSAAMAGSRLTSFDRILLRHGKV